MDRSAFKASPNVIGFIDWLVNRHHTLSIGLDIKSSRFVPRGIQADLTGLDSLLQHYRWCTQGSVTGDWRETQEGLRKLGERLRRAIEVRDDDAVLEACRDILRWGGDRNFRVGAMPYLAELHGEGALADYLCAARRAFALDVAVIDERLPQAAKMNSMLTKVHALASTDGLPIYDSRVAAAVAALVELWRREEGREALSLPPELTFPATTSDRSVLYLFRDAQTPDIMSYASDKATETAVRWSSAKIRLGWLMSTVLEKAEGLFVTEKAADRMHSFEASLFMIGYDVTCLRGNWPGSGLDKKQRVTMRSAGRARLRREQASLPHKSIRTLKGDEENLKYTGTIETGISGTWGETPFAFDSDFLQELLTSFPSGCEVGLGASMTGIVQPDTIGFWIDQHYPGKPRRDASALAAIFVNQGLAEEVAGTRWIRLRFL